MKAKGNNNNKRQTERAKGNELAAESRVAPHVGIFIRRVAISHIYIVKHTLHRSPFPKEKCRRIAEVKEVVAPPGVQKKKKAGRDGGEMRKLYFVVRLKQTKMVRGVKKRKEDMRVLLLQQNKQKWGKILAYK